MGTTDSTSSRDARRAARARWSGRIARDGSQEELDVAGMTPEERVLAVWTATRAAWAFTGRPLPDVPRSDWPGEVHRPS